MMTTRITLRNATRASFYWLVLALWMVIAGQLMVSGHWHDDGQQNTDDYCSLCVLSCAMSDGIISSAPWFIPVLAIVAVIATLCIQPRVRRQSFSYYDSQAPPFFAH